MQWNVKNTKMNFPEGQKKANNIRRWSGKAVRAPAVQIPIWIYGSSTDLQQSGSTGQCSLTALGPMQISLSSANETLPLVQVIVKGNLTIIPSPPPGCPAYPPHPSSFPPYPPHHPHPPSSPPHPPPSPPTSGDVKGPQALPFLIQVPVGQVLEYLHTGLASSSPRFQNIDRFENICKLQKCDINYKTHPDKTWRTNLKKTKKN